MTARKQPVTATRAKKPAAPARKRIFLVDDHPMMRAGMAQLINKQPGLEVCCEAGQIIGQGKSTRDIAQQLHLNSQTVDVHRAHIKEKLELNDATSLVRYAVRWVETEATGG